MKISRLSTIGTLMVMLLTAVGAQAEVSLKDAKEIGEKNLKKLVDQSYHYRVEFDTVIVLPVHSKTVWKNDFYLLYFLKNDYFQVEMEIDKVTGQPTILAMGEMMSPYHALPRGTFNHRYFCMDSIMHYSSARQRLQQDSVKLVYFGVIPELGKRGVIWEVFSSEGVQYFSLAGPKLTRDKLVQQINTKMRKAGNYTADSIRMVEIIAEVGRLRALSHNQKQELKLDPKRFDSVMTVLNDEKQRILSKFPDMRRKLPVDSLDSAAVKKN